MDLKNVSKKNLVLIVESYERSIELYERIQSFLLKRIDELETKDGNE